MDKRPSSPCTCGHVAQHHTRRDSVYAGLMADYRVVWRCAWNGCGCPEYVPAPTEVVRSPRCKDVCVKEFGAESCDAFGQPCLDAKSSSKETS